MSDWKQDDEGTGGGVYWPLGEKSLLRRLPDVKEFQVFGMTSVIEKSYR